MDIFGSYKMSRKVRTPQAPKPPKPRNSIAAAVLDPQGAYRAKTFTPREQKKSKHPKRDMNDDMQ